MVGKKSGEKALKQEANQVAEATALVQASVPKSAHRQLKQLTIIEDKTLQELVREAVNLLFQSRKLPPIA